VICVANMTKQEPHISQGKRLEYFYKSLKLNGKSFAKSIGCAQSLISSVVTADKPLTHTLANKITQRYSEFNIGWLFTGHGPMYLTDVTDLNPEKLALNEPIAEYSKPKKKAAPLHEFTVLITDMQERIAALEGEMAEMKVVIDKLRHN